MGSADNFCLRWNGFGSKMSSSFQKLRQRSQLFDVTLCCDNGQDTIRAHRVLLAACSPFFRRVLSQMSDQTNPFLYLRGVNLEELAAILNFIYQGEVSVPQDNLSKFLAVAEGLTIFGLTTSHCGSAANDQTAADDQDEDDDDDDDGEEDEEEEEEEEAEIDEFDDDAGNMTEQRASGSSAVESLNRRRKLASGKKSKRRCADHPSDSPGSSKGYKKPEEPQFKRLRTADAPENDDLSGVLADPDKLFPTGGSSSLTDFDRFDHLDEDPAAAAQAAADFNTPGPSSSSSLGAPTSGLNDNCELEACTMSRTQRGHPFLLDVAGHSYIRDKETPEKTMWKCKHYHNLACKARLHTDGLIVVYRNNRPHSHDPIPVRKNKYMDEVMDTPMDQIAS